MFKRVLVANRGEIAVRIIYALKELGIESVAIYSEADRDSLHVALADYAVCVGPADARRSYLNIPQILSAAQVTGVDAIHPGYGFLAENPDFARIVEEHGFVFIGPNPETMELAGDKLMAKRVMKEVGVPVVPGTEEATESPEQALRWIESVGGFPVILKARMGGGGRGMRILRDPEELAPAMSIAKMEAQSAFGDPGLYMEKYLERPRHVEIQVAADRHGHVVALGERECSVQRRYQKLLEESPAVDPDLRERMQEAAVRGARALKYTSVGTFEFLVTPEGDFYFIELNTRLQVEHPVTEFVTGIDLVRTQILAAAGEPLPFRQEDISLKGHAIEVRVNAEDPENRFAPTPGRIEKLHLPGGPGVRVDSHIYQGYIVPPFYDSLLAKVIVHDEGRPQAIRRMIRALEEFYIEGVKTTIPFHLKLLQHPAFQEGRVDVGFVERELL